MTGLFEMGFGAERAAQMTDLPGLVPARVIAEHRSSLTLLTEAGEMPGIIPGHLRHQAGSRSELPAVGDWVAVEPSTGTVQEVLPRTSAFVRRAAGRETEEQVVAANVDVVFLCTAVGRDLNLRRLERYLALAWQSGAAPVVLLMKSDLADDVQAALDLVAGIAPGVPVQPVSAVTGTGVDQVATYATGSKTLAFLGSSGVGKSTLINRLLGRDAQTTRELGSEEKGRHTTTRRDLLPLPGGGMLMDTPGMRELQLWGADDGLSRTFQDVEALAEGCRFRDCAHDGEPGCAVLEAVRSGALDGARLESYLKLASELARVSGDARERAAKKGFDKSMQRALRARLREKGRGD